MDSANINTAEQNIAQVKTALKAFVENEKIAKMLGKDFVSEMNDWEALIEKKKRRAFHAGHTWRVQKRKKHHYKRPAGQGACTYKRYT